MGDLQRTVQFPQSGVSSRETGTVFLLIYNGPKPFIIDSSEPPIEWDVNLDVVFGSAYAGAAPCSEQTPLVLPPQPVTIPGSVSVEPQCGRGVSQVSGAPMHTSQISNESSSGTSGVPDAPSALHSGQRSSVPNLPMPLTTSQLRVEE